MKVEGITLNGDMERIVYAAAYGAEFSRVLNSSEPPSWMVLYAADYAATRGRQAVEAFRKMLEDVQ